MLKRTRENKINLFDTIFKQIKNADHFKNLNEETKLRLTTSLFEFINNSISKYIKGQKEHGGDITEKDLDLEINQEIIDLYWYNEGRKWKTKNEAVNKKNSKKIKQKLQSRFS